MRKSHVVAVGSGVAIAAEFPLAQDGTAPAVDAGLAVDVPEREPVVGVRSTRPR